jgi:SAM-dependent methyltransferase
VTRPARFRDQFDWLRPGVEGKRVLYVGTVDDEPANAAKHPPTQSALARIAASVTGVYRSEEQARALSANGLTALAADVEELELGEVFNVVVAADTIEHVSNAGRFLRSVERHLDARGVVLVTTPNPGGLVRILELLARGRSKANVAHTCWYTAQVLDQLARRHGLRVVEEVHIDEMSKYHSARALRGRAGLSRRVAAPVLIAFNRAVCVAFPQFSETLGLVLMRTESQASA